MTDEDDIDGLAAEYVLGSLEPAERAAVEARSKAEAPLAAAIEAWQRRLGPLSANVPEVEPPADLFKGILSRVSTSEGQPARVAEVIPLRRGSVRRGPAFTVVAGALAACLAAVLVWDTPPIPQPGAPINHASCGTRYMDFWANFDQQKVARISAEQLAGVSRLALRAYDACEAGDEQDANALFERLSKMQF